MGCVVVLWSWWLDSTAKGTVMRAWILITIVVLGCGKNPQEGRRVSPITSTQKVTSKQVGDVRLVRIPQADGNVTYLLGDQVFLCNQDSTSCRRGRVQDFCPECVP